ncbi:outer membrane lipoprotein carrier protein LolA [Bdellovibrionota bacterium]
MLFICIFLSLVGCTKRAEKPPVLEPPAQEEPAPPPPPTAEEKAIEAAKEEIPLGVLQSVINKVQKNYDKMNDFEVKVTQTVTKVYSRRPHVSEGTIYAIKPSKIYWHITSPEELKTLGNGKKFWVYDPENKQVFIQEEADSHDQTRIVMLFLSGSGKFSDEFEIRSHKGDRFHWRLIPKKKIPQIKSLFATINRRTNWLDTLTIEYTYNETIELKFGEYKTNQGLAEKHQTTPLDPLIGPDFTFHPPEGTKEVTSFE